MKISILKRQKVLIPILLVAIIATANIFITNNFTPGASKEVTLNNLATINHAYAEDAYNEAISFCPIPEPGWQTFWSNFGNCFEDVWDLLVDFFDNFHLEPTDGEGGFGIRFYYQPE